MEVISTPVDELILEDDIKQLVEAFYLEKYLRGKNTSMKKVNLVEKNS